MTNADQRDQRHDPDFSTPDGIAKEAAKERLEQIEKWNVLITDADCRKIFNENEMMANLILAGVKNTSILNRLDLRAIQMLPGDLVGPKGLKRNVDVVSSVPLTHSSERVITLLECQSTFSSDMLTRCAITRALAKHTYKQQEPYHTNNTGHFAGTIDPLVLALMLYTEGEFWTPDHQSLDRLSLIAAELALLLEGNNLYYPILISELNLERILEGGSLLFYNFAMLFRTDIHEIWEHFYFIEEHLSLPENKHRVQLREGIRAVFYKLITPRAERTILGLAAFTRGENIEMMKSLMEVGLEHEFKKGAQEGEKLGKKAGEKLGVHKVATQLLELPEDTYSRANIIALMLLNVNADKTTTQIQEGLDLQPKSSAPVCTL